MFGPLVREGAKKDSKRVNLLRFLRVAMDAIEAMTVLRNCRILSVFAAVSYPRQYCNIYGLIDDVLIAGKTKEDHDARLTAVLTRISKSGLTLKKNQSACLGQPKFVSWDNWLTNQVHVQIQTR